MSISLTEELLKQFAEQFLDIQGIVLVSAEGQPLTTSIGLDENVTLIMAGTLLQVGNRITQECEWLNMEQVSLQAREGYLTIIPCTEDVFILIKTANTPNNIFEKELQQIIQIIAGQFEEKDSLIPEDINVPQPSNTTVNPVFPAPTPSVELKPNQYFLVYCQQELTEFIGPIAPFVCQRILKKNPDFSLSELVEALVKTIPNPEQAKEFYRRIYREWGIGNRE